MTTAMKKNFNGDKGQDKTIKAIVSGSTISESKFIRSAIEFYLKSKQYKQDFKGQLKK